MQIMISEWALREGLYERESKDWWRCVGFSLANRVRTKDLPIWWIIKYLPNEEAFARMLETSFEAREELTKVCGSDLTLRHVVDLVRGT